MIKRRSNRTNAQGNPVVCLNEYGGNTRDCLSVEVGRFNTRSFASEYDGDRALNLIAEWLRDKGVKLSEPIPKEKGKKVEKS